MLNESPNNDFHWRNKLEGLKSNAGELFNKEAAWDKLHGRLQKKSGVKSLFGYMQPQRVCCLHCRSPGFGPAEKKMLWLKIMLNKNRFKSQAIFRNI